MSAGIPQIDDERYKAGRGWFDNGGTLRTVVEALQKDKLGKDEGGELSFVLGFADAFLDRLRKV